MSYNPSDATASNTPYATSGKPDSARSYFFDRDNTFRFRPFLSLEEVLSYFPNPTDRLGHFPVIINSGGVLDANTGYIIGGTNSEYWWKDGVADSDLVTKEPVAIPSILERLEALEYIPIQILTFTNNKNVVEKGTVVTSIIFNFTFNKVISTGSINNNIGEIVPNENTLLKAVNITQNTTFNLTVSDGKQTATKTTSLLFQNKAYWGVSDSDILSNEQILALSNSVLTTTKTRNYTIAGEGKKLVYAVPSFFGNVSFNLGGFPFTALTKRTQNVTNAMGYTTSYDVYITDTVQYGTNIQVETI